MREIILNVATVVATLTAVAMAAVGIHKLYRVPSLPEERQPRTVLDWRRYTTQGARLGPANPRVTVVEFADFQCPFCRQAAVTLRELRRSYPRDVAIVYRHFPLDDVSLAAARAAECGNRAGFFEEIHDRFFAQPDSLGVKAWTRFAWESGIQDTLQFSRCLEDRSVISVVARDVQAASQLDIRGTPTLLVNDQLFTGSPGLKYLKRVVKQAVTESKK